MSVRVQILAGALAAGLSLSGCEAVSEAPAPAGPAAVAPPQAAPLTASGPAETLAAEPATDDSLMSAASVVRVDWVAEDGAKMFGTAGGDPAANGLYTYIAFFTSPGDGWVIYRLGDFLDYTVLSSSTGRVDLDIHETTIDEASGELGSRHRKVIVSWTVPEEGEAPAAITVTPAS